MSDAFDPMSAPPGYDYEFPGDDGNPAGDTLVAEAPVETPAPEAPEAEWELPESELDGQATRVTDESDQTDSAEVDAEADSSPAEAPEAVQAAPVKPKAKRSPASPTEVPERPKRSYTRGGAADFGGLRQKVDSATGSQTLVRKLLEHGTVKINLDGEAKVLLAAKDTPAAESTADMAAARAKARTRVVMRLIQTLGVTPKYGTAKGALSVATVNAQTIEVTLNVAPRYIGAKDRPTRIVGRIAAQMKRDGVSFADAVRDAELEGLPAADAE